MPQQPFTPMGPTLEQRDTPPSFDLTTETKKLVEQGHSPSAIMRKLAENPAAKESIELHKFAGADLESFLDQQVPDARAEMTARKEYQGSKPVSKALSTGLGVLSMYGPGKWGKVLAALGGYLGYNDPSNKGMAESTVGTAFNLFRNSPLGSKAAAAAKLTQGLRGMIPGVAEGAATSLAGQYAENPNLDPKNLNMTMFNPTSNGSVDGVQSGGGMGLLDRAAVGGLASLAGAKFGRAAQNTGALQREKIIKEFPPGTEYTENQMTNMWQDSDDITTKMIKTRDQMLRWFNQHPGSTKNRTRPVWLQKNIDEVIEKTGIDPAALDPSYPQGLPGLDPGKVKVDKATGIGTAGDPIVRDAEQWLKPRKKIQAMLEQFDPANPSAVPAAELNKRFKTFVGYIRERTKNDKAVSAELVRFLFNTTENDATRKQVMGRVTGMGADVINDFFKSPYAYSRFVDLNSAVEKIATAKLANPNLSVSRISGGNIGFRVGSLLYILKPEHIAEAIMSQDFTAVEKVTNATKAVRRMADNPLSGGNAARLLDRLSQSLLSVGAERRSLEAPPSRRNEATQQHIPMN